MEKINDTISKLPKYFLNDKDSIVSDFLTGLSYSNNNLVYYKDCNVIIDKSQLKENKVRLICGGGSGHEPAHAGFVLNGMLTAAVCGDIFSSPSYVNILKAIDLVYSEAGVVLLIKNYTGDLINFKLAKEIAIEQGKKVEMLIIDDDISLLEEFSESKIENKPDVFNKKRGLCGIILVYKILGEMSRSGKSLEEIIECGQNLIPQLYTIGVSLTNCLLPFVEYTETLEIPSDECEIGLGIHGEKGKERIKCKNIGEIIDHLFKNFFNKHFIKNISNDAEDNIMDIVLIVNNLGSLTELEIFTIINLVINYLKTKYNNTDYKINLRRIIFGSLMTSLDMKGFSLTIFNLTQASKNYVRYSKEYILSLIDHEVSSKSWNVINTEHIDPSNIISEEKKDLQKFPDTNIRVLFRELSNYLISKSNYLNDLDKEVGDGDLGSGVEKALSHVLSYLDNLDFENNLKSSFNKIGDLLASNFGGTSGPLYAAFFIKGSQRLKEKESENNFKNWIEAFENGVRMIQVIGRAHYGDRTMIDIMLPLSELLKEAYNKSSSLEELKNLIHAEIESSLERIKNLKSKRGRSSYMEGKEIGKNDPGSVLVSLWMKFILDKI
jgi:dihydroxyacetone kinase